MLFSGWHESCNKVSTTAQQKHSSNTHQYLPIVVDSLDSRKRDRICITEGVARGHISTNFKFYDLSKVLLVWCKLKWESKYKVWFMRIQRYYADIDCTNPFLRSSLLCFSAPQYNNASALLCSIASVLATHSADFHSHHHLSFFCFNLIVLSRFTFNFQDYRLLSL